MNNKKIEESKPLKKRHIRVHPIPGAKIDDIKKTLVVLLHNDLERVVIVVIHAATNNSVTDTLQNIVDKLIKALLPRCRIIISRLIVRIDNSKANVINRSANELIKPFIIEAVVNSNIMEKNLGKGNLH